MLKVQEEEKLLSLYSKKFDYSLGGTPIGSTGRAPDEDGNIGYYTRVKN
jgi:hypothetical protein